MKEVLNWLNKYGIIILIVLGLLILAQTCGNKNKLRGIDTTTEKTNVLVDSTVISLDEYMVLSKEEFRIMLEINKLETAKRILFDWNSIVRTVVRPDDRMNFYDEEIEKLQNQLNQIRTNKALKK